MTKICIPIFLKKSPDDLEESLAQAEDALSPINSPDQSSGMIELRADNASPKSLLAALDLLRLPAIVTIRPTWEGGLSTYSDPERLKLFEAAIEAGADYIDIELIAWEKSKSLRDTLTDLSEKHGTRLILSSHHFQGRPKDLSDRLARLRKIQPASILKLAWKASSLLDALEALRLTSKNATAPQSSPRILALAMGEEGILSRLLAKKFSAPFTFASLEAGKESAPGQPTVSELRNLYRWNHQTPDSPVFGVVGFPLAHSLSPHLHNAGFDATHSPGIYVPLLIQPNYEAFHAALEALRSTPNLNLRGLSITIPHKENAFRYIIEQAGIIDDLSARIGAINTITFPIENRKWGGAEIENPRGLNTDCPAALEALVTAWSGKLTDLQNKRIAILGAGGAARAIIAGLASHGATVTIFNRTLEKAQALAAEFPHTSAASLDQLTASTFDALINCTPLGMHPKTNASPLDNLPEPDWSPQTVIFDTIYNPRLTKLLKLAQKKGCRIVTGDEMFLRQAALQFEQFTSHAAPVELFQQILQKNL